MQISRFIKKCLGSNPQTPLEREQAPSPDPTPLGTSYLVSGPSVPQLYGPPYLFSCNSATALIYNDVEQDIGPSL